MSNEPFEQIVYADNETPSKSLLKRSKNTLIKNGELLSSDSDDFDKARQYLSYMDSGDIEKAQNICYNLSQNDSEYKFPAKIMSLILTQNFSESLEILTKEVQTKETNQDITFLIAYCLIKIGKFRDASLLINELLRRENKCPAY